MEISLDIREDMDNAFTRLIGFPWNGVLNGISSCRSFHNGPPHIDQIEADWKYCFGSCVSGS